MDRFWIEKARKYIEEHNAFEDVSDITTGNGKHAIVSAKAKVNLPGRFIKAGATGTGLRDKEEVHFIFSESFPLKAPLIKLRDDFPRCFPHINPSEKHVIPCIYEGNLSELLQQSEWMNGILNQLADWLEKAASNDLMNYDQGWEPMRNDNAIGFINYDIDDVLSVYAEKQDTVLSREIYYEKCKGLIFTDSLCSPEKRKKSHAIFALTLKVIDRYLPNTITTLSHLYEYADSMGMAGIKTYIEKIDIENIDEDKIFVVLSVRRPVKIIGSESNIEFLNFVISKAKHRKKGGRELKRTLPDCKVGMLSHIALRSPALLQRISGTTAKNDKTKNIAFVGCGSLGSKIGIHLARNGNGPFLCVDNDIFMPHNHARHALTFTFTENKAKLLSLSMQNISGVTANPTKEDAFKTDFGSSRMIIDTTASFSVRNFLMSRADLPPVISCGLYGRGRSGLMLIENENRTGSLAGIWAHLYHKALKDDDIHGILFSSSLENVSIGQSCSSQTMVVDDARISLLAATMSLKIQNILEAGLPRKAEILFSQYDEHYSLRTVAHTVPDFIPVKSILEKEWMVFISEPLIERMRYIMRQKSPNETGGALLGSVFLYPNTVVITDIIDAPPDSVETPTLFVLGVVGLERKIKDTEKRSNGKVTYLGTWHSHPHGGKASQTDELTFKKLLFVRNYEPTVCLIITEDEVMMV